MGDGWGVGVGVIETETERDTEVVTNCGIKGLGVNEGDWVEMGEVISIDVDSSRVEVGTTRVEVGSIKNIELLLMLRMAGELVTTTGLLLKKLVSGPAVDCATDVKLGVGVADRVGDGLSSVVSIGIVEVGGSITELVSGRTKNEVENGRTTGEEVGLVSRLVMTAELV